MPPRTLASLAHSLSAAADLDAALVALGEALADVDRSAQVTLLRYEARRQMLRDRLTPVGHSVEAARVDTTFDHLPSKIGAQITAGGEFVELADESDEYARLFGLPALPDEGLLSLRGLRTDGHLSAVIALYEPKRIFGTRVVERFGPYVALFELGYARFSEREAREEAVRTLEDVTQRVHGEYVKRLAELEQQLAQARGTPPQGVALVAPDRLVTLEADAARAKEEARRAQRRMQAVEQQVSAAVGQLEQAHVELHRRSEALRQRTRTLYLIDRVLSLDAGTADPRQLVEGLLALVGDDMQAQRCSLMLRVPETEELYIAAAKGLAPAVTEGARIKVGQGVAGKVALSREPLLVTDVEQASSHPLLRDEYFTTGSFISFPLVYHDQLVGVVNLTNRALRGVFVDEDVERVRLLALLISLVASHAALPERLLETIGVR
ncbi:MAG TPA: GAF domain-containing protein [Gemmatimonadaceae bacterium]|jgi:putative methionine-R-sulfoxide reductase with GAF domain|nr:GAF domain-containing protein [Gemmatimonadaceae bacterium]